MRLTAQAVLNRGGVAGSKVLNYGGVSPGTSSSARINYTLTDFAIGHMKDDPEVAYAAAEYLKRHQTQELADG